MRIFVAGATGVLGRGAVRELVGAGHHVTAVARTDEKAAELRSQGATPASVDLFDRNAIAAAVAGHDAVCNLATHIPPMSRAALPGAWATNDRLRNEASHNLAAGALAGGARRFVQESIAFMYADAADRWIDEEAPLDPVGNVRSVLRAEAAAADFTAAAASAGGAGVVLRFALFYGPGSSHTLGAIKAARRRIAMFAGDPDGYLSSIHTDDAATAVLAALEVPAGTYNIGDDEPVTRRDHADILADALDRPRLRIVPTAVARLGGSKVELLTRSQRVSNARFRHVAGWAPAYPSVREGLPAVIAALAFRPQFG